MPPSSIESYTVAFNLADLVYCVIFIIFKAEDVGFASPL